MAAGLNVSNATVEGAGLKVEGAAVSVRLNVARVVKRRDVIAEQAGALAVVRVGRREWRIEFDDGSSWTVTKRSCGCGG